MTNLKTLKDLNHIRVSQGRAMGKTTFDVNVGELRQEAIKWVKHCEKKWKKERYDQIFKEFFNLTEEDLK